MVGGINGEFYKKLCHRNISEKTGNNLLAGARPVRGFHHTVNDEKKLITRKIATKGKEKSQECQLR